MLVKFKNDSEEFESKVDVLKSVLNVGAASKVAEYCVDNYSDLDVRYQKALKENERLLDVINQIRDQVRAKQSAEETLHILLGKSI